LTISRAGATVLLVAAALWLAWVVAHYYAFILVRPEITDGVFGNTFQYWREALHRALAALAGAALTLLAAWGLGRTLLRRLTSTPPRQALADETGIAASPLFDGAIEQTTFVLASGFVALSSFFLLCAWLHVYSPTVVRALLIVMALVGLVQLRGSLFRSARVRRRGVTNDSVPQVCILAAFVFAFVAALAPEVEHDALWYHLWLPQQWLATGGPVDIIHEYVSLYPLSWELLYGAAMTIGGPVAARLLHFACLPLLAAATWLLTRSILPGANATFAVAFAVSTPIVIWEATTAYADLSLALFLTLSVHALFRFQHTGRRSWLVLSAVMMGAGLATKHLALLALTAIATMMLARQLVTRAPWRPALRASALFLTIAFFFAAPWYARAFAASGNPFFPDMYALFGAHPPERWSPATEEALQRFKSRFGRERHVSTLALLPWDLSVHGARYGGTLGPVFLMLVPLAFAGARLPRSARLAAGGGAIYLALWASPLSSFQMRFLIPLVPLLGAFSSAGLTHLTACARRVHPRLAGVVVAPVTLVLLMNLPPFTRFHERDRDGRNGWLSHVTRALPTRVVLGAMREDDYLDISLPSYAAWQFINRNLPVESRILTFTTGDHLYGNRDRLWSDATVAFPVTWATSAGKEADALRAARRLGISHVLFDKRQIADGDLASLAIHSSKMRSCCLTTLWEDSRYELNRLEIPESIAAGPSEP
jgi:4-amino-4-deoxy-L-arabinose transferase-like glycosyltransferase